MTTRMQITLDPELQRRSRERAKQLGISFAEYIRRLVARDLSEVAPAVDPSRVFKLGHSGGTDVAQDKDVLVAQALEAELRRERSRR